MFLKQKWEGKIKGRTVAGGNKQQDYASSPTVATESVLLSCIIDSEEERDVAVVDIPNTFVQTRVENEKDMAFIKIGGILVEIAPDVYKYYVSKDKKGSTQFLVQCQKSLYDTMVSSLLYYQKFVKSFTDIDFVINPYDPCGANKMIEGDQMTICFHVYDFKLSHRKTKVIDIMIDVKLLPLLQPPVRARTDARTNPSAQRATQLRSVLARVYAVSIQNQITTTVP
jgi:hypothetical protein